MNKFVPRTVFPTLDSIPRSYYLGHHAAGLSKMRTMLSQINLIIECRDSRIPLTSNNPLFEDSLAGRQRVIVHTKKDLALAGSVADTQKLDLLRQWHQPSKVIFSNHKDSRDVRCTLDLIRAANETHGNLTGSQLMVVGMPNVGKSSLLNALRRAGVNKGKAARTGAQPGITRKIATGVKIVEASKDGFAGGVYVLDTPGVFMPYVPDAEAMLKLALCGSVKDTIVPPFNLADYLLYQLNLQDPALYAEWCHPTNDAMELLEVVARKTGRLGKGGEPDFEGTALWLIQRWRSGQLGVFMLDEVSQISINDYELNRSSGPKSLNQARKAEKENLRVRNKLRRAGTTV